MLPKKNRADKKAVEKIFKEGRVLNSPHLSFRFMQTLGGSPARISFIAPKTVSKLAVGRNALRRRGYSILTDYVNKFPNGLVGVMIYKKKQTDKAVVENEIKSILSKID